MKSKMRNRIAFKLSFYFAIAVIVFAVIVSLLFAGLFRERTMDFVTNDTELRASVIADELSLYFNDETHMGDEDYTAFINNIDEIALADIWVVDRNLNSIVSREFTDADYVYKQMPPEAADVVSKVFEGEKTVTQSFSSMMETSALIVGSPVINSGGDVIGAVLLHSTAERLNVTLVQTTLILGICIIVALVITIHITTVFSIKFTEPLKKIKNSALKLAEGDYSVKTGISGTDEIGVLASTIDILSERLNEAENQSGMYIQMHNDFIANVSHELRTPITVLRGSLEALCDGVVTDANRIQEYLKLMLSETKTMQRLVGDLLDLVRLQNSDFKIEKQFIYLYDVLDDVARSVKAFAREKNINIELSVHAEYCNILGDYDRIKQMFTAVLDNAIKFSNPFETVYIRLWEKDSLYVSIRDTGKGIPREELPYIFRRFYKTDDLSNKSGTGLGLAIAQQIAVRHNIHIMVNSEIGHGSEFIFEIQKVNPAENKL